MGQHPGTFLQVSNLAVPDNTLSAYTHVSFLLRVRNVGLTCGWPSLHWPMWWRSTGEWAFVQLMLGPEGLSRVALLASHTLQLPASAQAQEPWQSLCSRSRSLSRNMERGYQLCLFHVTSLYPLRVITYKYIYSLKYFRSFKDNSGLCFPWEPLSEVFQVTAEAFKWGLNFTAFFVPAASAPLPRQYVLRAPCAEFQNCCGGLSVILQARAPEHNTHVCTKANAPSCTCGPNLARFLNAL